MCAGIFAGGVIESCAYNPTINPLQAACIAYVAAGQGSYTQVGIVPPPCHVSSTRVQVCEEMLVVGQVVYPACHSTPGPAPC